MKQILTLLAVLLLTIPGGNVYAQKNKSEGDYNLRKAYEVLEEEKDPDKALELVSRQLESTPDNVSALTLRVQLLHSKHEYGQALMDVNRAIKVNKPKKSEIFNSTLYWWKGMIYQGLRDLESSAAALKTAYEQVRKDNPDYAQSVSFDYAQVLLRLNDLAGAESVLQRMLSEDETDQGAMVGLAWIMIKREQHKEAIGMLDRCQKFDPDYPEVYRFKMRAYDKLGEVAKTIDAGLEWYEKDDDPDTGAVLDMLVKRPNYAEAGIKTHIKSTENKLGWKILLAYFYTRLYKYAEAVKVYDEMESEFGRYDEIHLYRSECYSELGLHEMAIADISKVKEENYDWDTYCNRGDYYRLSGDLDAAIADFSAAIEEAPRRSYSYYKRGWCYEMKGDRKRALEDYDLGIEMEEDYPYLFLMRGELLLDDGKKAEAAADFERVLQLDSVANNNSCRMYALHFLGRDQEAEEWMNKILENDSEDNGSYYDQACLYSRMGRLEESVAALRKAFEKGYRDFSHIRLDDDMDAVRELPEFKALIAEYEAVRAEYLKEFELEMPEQEETVTEISVKRNPGGTFEIPCDINGLPLQMIFDTGASDVTISSVEANFMLKNGYLSEKDIKGKRYYQIADGQISEGTTITLREVKIGDAVLKNVDASVVKSQRAPLLLGQSAMARFGTITIDNQNNKLIIKH